MKKYSTRVLLPLCLLLFFTAACGSSVVSGQTHQSASLKKGSSVKLHSGGCFTRNSDHVDGTYQSDFDFAMFDSCGSDIAIYTRGEYDFEQVRYSLPGSNEVQFSFHGGVSSIPNVQSHALYTVKVQSCTSHPFGSSCTTWDAVTVATYDPGECYPGYVWRGATPDDRVCVTPDVRAQASYDNSQAASRVNPQGAYGPDTCLQGFVWRGVVDSDHVCVTPDTRAQVVDDNANAYRRTYN